MAIDLDLSDEDIAIIGGAILWHDYYYDTTTPEIYTTNEERSALRAESDLTRLRVSQEYITAIMTHIRETKHGSAQVPDEQRSQVMHDVDMSILASPASRYAQYAFQDIPAEFAAMVPNRQDFHRARIERFIRPTLDRVTELFLTPYGREHF
jgi:predicted metal-dependent HD superfamily phosphohydrolase